MSKPKKESGKVCLRCGSTRLRTPSPAGFVPGRSENAGLFECEECGLVAAPLEVEDVEEYKKHLKKFGTKRG